MKSSHSPAGHRSRRAWDALNVSSTAPHSVLATVCLRLHRTRLGTRWHGTQGHGRVLQLLQDTLATPAYFTRTQRQVFAKLPDDLGQSFTRHDVLTSRASHTW